jgi:hypothetical protein
LVVEAVAVLLVALLAVAVAEDVSLKKLHYLYHLELNKLL